MATGLWREVYIEKCSLGLGGDGAVPDYIWPLFGDLMLYIFIYIYIHIYIGGIAHIHTYDIDRQ